MMLESIAFLGESQTFIGVLATVIVMCVIVGESNFIHKILDLIKRQMADNLKNVSAEVSFAKLHDDSDYKLLKVLISDKKMPPEYQSLGGQLLSDISLWKSTAQVESAKSEMQGEDRELTQAALYSFLFVLVLFLFDELFRTTLIPYNDFMVSVLSLFTLFSSIYWVCKWGTYVLDLIRNNGKRTYNLVTESRLTKLMLSLHQTSLKNDWWRMLLEILYSSSVVAAMTIANIDGPLLTYAIIIVGVLPPFIAEGLFHLYPIEKIESDLDDGYKTILNHFGRMLFMSIAVSALFVVFDNTFLSTRGMMLSYDNLRTLKIFSVGFIIFNGLVIPSVLPFHTYRYLSRSVLKKPNRLQKRVDREITAYLKKVKGVTCNFSVE